MEKQEGRLPLSFQAYTMLCFAALGIGFAADQVFNTLMFAHVYLVWQWNLMVRTNQVSSTGFHHLSWKDDCMFCHHVTQKNDEEGTIGYDM